MFDRHQAAECIKVYADRAIEAAEQEDWNNYILEVMNALRATHTALHLHLSNPENITTQKDMQTDVYVTKKHITEYCEIIVEEKDE